jgi:uncharacterized membrane protein YeaQ/YmgE (transglycosylase-associated protein family)
LGQPLFCLVLGLVVAYTGYMDDGVRVQHGRVPPRTVIIFQLIHSPLRRNNMEFLDAMGCISWIIFGSIAGWIASMITGNSGRNGCLTNIILGVIGAGIGGMVMNFFGSEAMVTGFNFQSFLVAVVGAVLVLAIFNFIRSR